MPEQDTKNVRSRLAGLLALPNNFSDYYHTSSRDSSLASIADQFFYDVRSISKDKDLQLSTKLGWMDF